FYFIDKRLKRKDLAIVYSHLPPLMVVERQLYQLVFVGTALLSLALLSGFVFLDSMLAIENAHKTVLSIIAWGVFLAVVIGRKLRGWRGKSSVITIMVGAGLLTLA
ncbi:cytochrome c biogenesis protein CcsA, partial [Pseudoalteromonas rubra]